MEPDFNAASFRDFENMPGKDFYGWADAWKAYAADRLGLGQFNYRQENQVGCGPEARLELPATGHRQFVNLTTNDYLGLSQHPAVMYAAIEGVIRYGTSAGSSPAIGGHYAYHREIEQSIARFFGWERAIVFATGYSANSGTLQTLLKKEDLAILDMAVHASVYEGCQLTNVKTFPHNNLDALERTLRLTKGRYRARLVIIDGVYSQDGDVAPVDRILELCRHYGAYLMVDDAHGTGVIGETGRGVLERYGLLQDVDFITGTFSKTFAHIGGYVIAKPEVVEYLKFQVRPHIFSATLPPPAACIPKAIALVDQEPHRMDRLWDNVRYLRLGLDSLGLDTGITQSAIIPVKIGDINRNAMICGKLLEAGVYANQINYPAVAKKDARIRMSVSASHTQEQLDTVLEAWEGIAKKYLPAGETKR